MRPRFGQRASPRRVDRGAPPSARQRVPARASATGVYALFQATALQGHHLLFRTPYFARFHRASLPPGTRLCKRASKGGGFTEMLKHGADHESAERIRSNRRE